MATDDPGVPPDEPDAPAQPVGAPEAATAHGGVSETEGVNEPDNAVEDPEIGHAPPAEDTAVAAATGTDDGTETGDGSQGDSATGPPAPETPAPLQVIGLGHSCLYVRYGSTSLLLDPGVFSTAVASALDGPAGLDPDAVFITHAHPDHIDPALVPSITAAVGSVGVYAEADAAKLVTEAGGQASVLAPGDTVEVGDGAQRLVVTAVGGQHAEIHPDLPRVGNVGLLMRAGDLTLFHPGDSYETVPTGVDVLALPLNAPWASVAQTVEFVRAVGPTTVLPIHDGLLRHERREIYLAHVRNLGGADVHDLATDGPLRR